MVNIALFNIMIFLKQKFSLSMSSPFIQCAKIKALKIHKCRYSPKISNNNFSNNNSLYRYIILPNNSTTKDFEKTKQNNLGIKTVTNSSKTIRNLINDKNNNAHIESRAGIYNILHLDSNKKYMSEISHNLKKMNL